MGAQAAIAARANCGEDAVGGPGATTGAARPDDVARSAAITSAAITRAVIAGVLNLLALVKWTPPFAKGWRRWWWRWPCSCGWRGADVRPPGADEHRRWIVKVVPILDMFQAGDVVVVGPHAVFAERTEFGRPPPLRRLGGRRLGRRALSVECNRFPDSWHGSVVVVGLRAVEFGRRPLRRHLA